MHFAFAFLHKIIGADKLQILTFVYLKIAITSSSQVSLKVFLKSFYINSAFFFNINQMATLQWAEEAVTPEMIQKAIESLEDPLQRVCVLSFYKSLNSKKKIKGLSLQHF